MKALLLMIQKHTKFLKDSKGQEAELEAYEHQGRYRQRYKKKK